MAGNVESFVHGAQRFFCLAVKTFGRHQETADTLMCPPIVEMIHPTLDRPPGFMQVGKRLLRDQFLLDSPITGLDLAQGLRMMRPRMGVIDP
jgi:hypothetical protein